MDVHESSPGSGGEDTRAETPPDQQIMAKLPRSRPKRQTARRKPARAGVAKPTAPKGTATAPSGPDPGVFGPREPAPGLPRLALDGAIEAAKMPVKVGANVTFHALDAVIKGLRRR